MLIVRWLEEEQARGVLRSDFDPRMMAMTIASLSTFPFLMILLLSVIVIAFWPDLSLWLVPEP